MKLFTTQTLIRDAALAWKQQYCSGGKWGGYQGNAEAVYNKLRKAKTKRDVTEAIGNNSWSTLTCDECSKDVETIVVLGQPPDYESNTANICPACLRKANALISRRSK